MSDVRCWSLVAAVAVFVQGAGVTGAEPVAVKNRTELVRAIRAAGPGTVIEIASGNYEGGFTHGGLRGAAGRPIVIRAADPKNPPVFQGGMSGVQLSSAQHIELRDLVIDGAKGNGLNLDDGGTIGSAHDIVLANLVVRNVGPEGNRDGIKLSGLDRFRIVGCDVSQWGSAGSGIDMVGCHDGVFSNCRLHSSRGASTNGIQAKGGSSNITIERCRFEDIGGRGVNAGGSTGLDYFRPKDADHEARNITIEDCEFLGGQCAVAFVGVDGATVRHNTIYRPTRWAFRILQETTGERFVPCRNGLIERNVIVFRSDELSMAFNVGPKTSPETFQLQGNVWHCIDRPEQSQRMLRLSPLNEQGGTYGQDPGLRDPEKGDLSIRRGAPDAAGVRPESE